MVDLPRGEREPGPLGGGPIPVTFATGARLAYREHGAGPPVVLVHGSLTDMRYWDRSGQVAALAGHHRVLTPSRRHNHPHPPTPVAGDYDARVDARDLIELIERVAEERVHLVGHSYGAYAALYVALEAPHLVRSLVLAEPPLMRWLPRIAGGEGVWEAFEAKVWRQLGDAFADGGDDAGLDATARWYFGAPLADVDPAWQQDFRDSVREWRALTTSADAFPMIPFERVAALQLPALVLSGGRNAGGFNDLIDTRLAQLLPDATREVVTDASHEMFLDAPERVATTLLAFFARSGETRDVSDGG